MLDQALRPVKDRMLTPVVHSPAGRLRPAAYTALSLVAAVAAGLRAAGLREGDRVGGFLPNCPEAVVAALATASLGAIWSSCSPDFGIKGVLDRFGQIQPKVLFTATEEVWQSSNLGFSLCSLLTHGAVDALLLHGPRRQFPILGRDADFLVLQADAQEPPRLSKAPIASHR